MLKHRNQIESAATLRLAALLACALAGVMGGPVRAAQGEATAYIGVLEDAQVDDPGPLSSQRHVRILFRRQEGAWQSMDSDFNTPQALASAGPHFPAEVTWTVAYDGKSLGTITSRNPGALHWYADVGVQLVGTEAGKVPRIAAGATSFGNVTRPARSRPLLLTSAGQYTDPDAWKPTTLTVEERRMVMAAFRAKIPTLDHCDRPETPPVTEIRYADDDVRTLKAYRDKGGRVLVGEQLDGARSTCQFYDDEHFLDHWFVIDQQQLKYLGIHMMPMEAADVDGTGRSSWIFFNSIPEATEGYTLFDADFHQRAHFEWHYH